MKIWQLNFRSVARKLGFGDKLKAGKLTADEQKQIAAEYEKEFGTTLDADKTAGLDYVPEAPLLSAAEIEELGLIEEGEETPETPKQVVHSLTSKVKSQQQTIEQLEQSPEPTAPVAVVAPSANLSSQNFDRVMGRTAHTPTHLFGIEEPMFSRDKWHVELTVNRKPVAKDLSKKQKNQFIEDFNKYSDQLIKRSNELIERNMLGLLDYNKLIAGASSIDYSDMFGKLGEYSVARTDIILAYLRSLPSVDHIFPVRSNVQNKEEAPGATFGELSQGYREGKIFKGSVSFTAEIYRVTDVMFKFLFRDLIKLEKQYIGDMNKEGSNVIKWTFIEWIMVHFGTILRNEQNVRRVMGTRVPQQNVTANPALLAADGAYRAIERVEEELKVYPNPEFKTYNAATIVDYFEAFWDFYTQILPSMVGYKLYANLKHRPWYIREFRKKYGRDTDFSGVTAESINDVDANIIWVPNAPTNYYKLFITIPGNTENQEDKPNEMFSFYFERDWEQVGVMSRWKEGSGLNIAGVQFKTLQELIKSNYEYQWIFTNYPVTDLSANILKLNAKVNSLFLTGANTTATNISSIENFRADSIVKVICGSMDNATTVKKAGIFSKISEDFIPKAEGDWIKFYPELEDYEVTIDGETVIKTRPTGNFLELDRRVTA